MKINHNIRFENPLQVIHQDNDDLIEMLQKVLAGQSKILAKIEKLSSFDFSEQIKKIDEIIIDIKQTV